MMAQDDSDNPSMMKKLMKTLPKYEDDRYWNDADELDPRDIAGLSEATRAALLRDHLTARGEAVNADFDPINMYHGVAMESMGSRIEIKSK